MTLPPIKISSAQNPPQEDFTKGVWQENPIFTHALGMCPTLAVTNSAINGLAMGMATLFVLLMSNMLVSSLRHHIPKQVRIACYILVIATFVTLADYVIAAISLSLHKALGAFIFLIVVNCLILSRAEAFASKNTVGRSMLDGLGMGCGFTLALVTLGMVREVLGSGTLFGMAIMPDAFEKWVIMLLPSGGFFTLALMMLALNTIRQRSKETHCG